MSGRLPTDPLQRQLQIKLGVVQRTQRELQGYHEELATQKAKVERMRAANADEYDVKKQVEVQAETEMMIPDTMRRLAKGVEELRAFVDTHGSTSGSSISGTQPLAAAVAVLAAAEAEGGGGEGGAGGGGAGAVEEDDGPI